MATTLMPEASVFDGFDDLSVWPGSTRVLPDGDLSVGGLPLARLAERFGTPVYLLDEDEVRARCRAYRRAFPDADVLYAAKAFLCRTMVRWVAEERLGLDVCSAGELETAVVAGFAPERIVLHGNAKTPGELEAALRLGVGRIVIDSGAEIARIAANVPSGSRQKVLVRVIPGLAAGAHPALRIGTETQKFGLSTTDGSAQRVIGRILGQPGMELVGLHCHLGSQVDSAKPYLLALRRMVGLLAWVREHHGVTLPELDLGGGHAVAYRPGEAALDLPSFAARARAELDAACAANDLPVPRLAIEPGRAVTGPAGVALYRVLAVKRTPGTLVVAVDGGMSDNPRPALYRVRYAPRLLGRRSSARPARATVVGRHCEAGDVLALDAKLPADVHPGDLLGVPVSGAYHLSMASSYNLVGRPPVVGVRDGRADLLIRRETLTDISSRDVGC